MRTAIALLASAIFLVRLMPQPVRLARTGVALGVSSLAAINAVLSAAAWLAYGVIAGLPVVWGVSVLALVPGIWTVVLLRHRITRGELRVALAVIAAGVAASLLGLLGLLLAVSVLLTSGPQVLKALREHDLTGIAPATWWVAIADASSWGLYGVLLGDRALEGYGTVLLASAVTVLTRIWWTSRNVSGAPAPAQNPVRQNGTVEAPNI